MSGSVFGLFDAIHDCDIGLNLLDCSWTNTVFACKAKILAIIPWYCTVFNVQPVT